MAIKIFAVTALLASLLLVALIFDFYRSVSLQANYVIPEKDTSEYAALVESYVSKAKKLDEYNNLMKQIKSEQQRIILEKITKSYIRGNIDFITPGAAEKFVREAIDEIEIASECMHHIFGKSGSDFLGASFSENSAQYLVALENSRFFAGEISSSKKAFRNKCVEIFKVKD